MDWLSGELACHWRGVIAIPTTKELEKLPKVELYDLAKEHDIESRSLMGKGGADRDSR